MDQKKCRQSSVDPFMNWRNWGKCKNERAYIRKANSIGLPQAGDKERAERTGPSQVVANLMLFNSRAGFSRVVLSNFPRSATGLDSKPFHLLIELARNGQAEHSQNADGSPDRTMY
jgi:hypothetical protein